MSPWGDIRPEFLMQVIGFMEFPDAARLHLFQKTQVLSVSLPPSLPLSPLLSVDLALSYTRLSISNLCWAT